MFFFFFPDSLEKDPADIRKGRRPQISAHLPFWANLAQQIHEIQPDLPHIQNESQLNFSNTLDSFTNTTPQSAKSTENSIQVRAIEAETDLQLSPILSPNFDSTFQQLHDSSAPLRADGEGIHDEDTVNRELLLRIVDPALIPKLNQFPDSVIPRNSSAVFDLGNWTLVFFYEDIDNLVLNCRGEVIPTSESPYAICDFGLTHRLLRVPTFPHALINVKHSNSASNAIESNIGSQTLPRSENSIIAVPSPNVTVESPTVNVEAPIVNVAPPSLNIEGTVVNVAPPAVEVAAPIINVSPSSAIVPVTVNPPAICVAPPSVSVAPQSISVAAPNVTLSPQTITVGAPSITLPSINFSSPSVSVAAPTISMPPINVTVNVPSAQETSKPETRGSISRLIRALEAIQDSSDGGDEAGEGGGEVKRAKVTHNSLSQRKQLKISERQSFTIIRSEDRRALEDLDERDGNETIYVSDGGPDEEPKPRKPFRVPNFSSPSSSDSEMVSNPKRDLSVANISSDSPAKNEEVRSEADKSQRRETAKEESSDDYGSAKSRSDRSQSSILITQLREALVKTASAPASALKEAIEAINLPKSKAIFETENSHAAPCNDIIEWIAENEWFPEPTQLQCSRCSYVAKNSNSLNAHGHKVHAKMMIINPLDAFYNYVGFDGEWALDSSDAGRLNDGSLRYNAAEQRFAAFVCPVPECQKAFSSYTGLREHLRGHKDKFAELKLLGGFWATVRWWVQKGVREGQKDPALIRFGAVLHSFPAYFCPLCPFHCSLKKEVGLHAVSAHTESESASLKGQVLPMGELIPLIPVQPKKTEEGNDKAVKRPEEERFSSGTKCASRQSNRAKLTKANTEKVAKHSNQTEAKNKGADTVVDWKPPHDNMKHESECVRDKDNGDNAELRSKQTEKWIERYSESTQMFLPVPTREERKKMSKEMKKLFRTKIVPLLKEHSPRDSSEEEWEHFDAAMLKVTHIIQKCLIIAMKKRLRGRERRKHQTTEAESSKAEELFELDRKRRDIHSLCGKLRELRHLYTEVKNQTRANEIAQLETEAERVMRRLPTDTAEGIFGRCDMESMRKLIREAEEEHWEGRFDWALKEIGDAEAKIEARSKKWIELRRQQQYRDDSRRAFRRIVAAKSPPCKLSIEEVESFFSKRWEKKEEFTEAPEESVWRLARMINSEEAENLLKMMENVKGIEETIRSRGLLSANGPDGIPNAAFKAAPIEAAIATQLIVKAMMKCRKCPSIWKSSRTVLIFKKEDPKDPANWRPISINSSWYRIAACHMADCITEINADKVLISRRQKGFIPGMSGCIEHSALANELIATAAREERQIFIAAIDFADAFGSVPHELIASVLRQLGLPEDFVGAIRDAYRSASTRISLNGELSATIQLKKGVKQGCPLSPLLFDLGLEPLIRRIEKENKTDGFHFVCNGVTETVSIQAYADDILLVANSEEGLSRMMKVVEEFCDFAKMKLAPRKCKVFAYARRHGRTEGTEEQFALGGMKITVEDIGASLEYLGAPLTRRTSTRLAKCGEEVKHITEPLEKLKTAGLTISQTLDAVKRFVLPSLDYALINGQIARKDLEAIDLKVRKLIGERIGGPSLPIELFYAPWRDGGLGLPRMEERADIMCINAYSILRLSSEEGTRKWIEEFTNNEAAKRGIEECDDAEEKRHFLNWKEQGGKLVAKRPRGRNTLSVRTFKACRRLGISLQFTNDAKATLGDISSVNSKIENAKSVGKGCVAKSIGMILSARHSKKLREDYPLKGHSFWTLKKSPESNFFVGNCSAPTSDALVRFTLRGRTNSLPTAENKKLQGVQDSDLCQLCHQKESLMHRLNGCRQQFVYFKERHNLIVEAVASAILTHVKPAPFLHRSTKISAEGLRLPEAMNRLLPDLWFIDTKEKMLHIVEITIPYGATTESEEGIISTLKARREEKLKKYSKLAKECGKQLGIETILSVIVISSLGAVPKETIGDLKKLLRCTKRNLKLICKRLCIKAILGSFRTFHHIRCHPAAHTAFTQGTGNAALEREDGREEAELSEQIDQEGMNSEGIEQLEERRVSQLQATN